IVSDNLGNNYITGSFASPSILFNCNALLNFDNTGSYDPFFVKIRSCTTNEPQIISTPGNIVCLGDSVQLTVSSASKYLWSNYDTTQSIYVHSSGNYFVTTSDSAKCTASSCPIQIIFLPLPSTPSIIQNGDSLESTSGVTYQWYLNDSLIINDTSQYLLPLQSGIYKVKITDSLGCSAISLPYNFSNLNVLLILNQKSIVISPNPSESFFDLNFQTLTNQLGQFTLCNSIGKEVLSKNLNGTLKTLRINTTALQNGIYFWKFQNQSGKLTIIK
ncbi:MAG: T9SS type A sorting domain-containing protein, partial [Flavobacterium sp.]